MSGYSQGLVAYVAGSSAATRMSTNSVVGGPSTGLTGTTPALYYYALFASVSQVSVNGQTTAVSGLNANYVFNHMGSGVATGWELVGIGNNSTFAGRMAAITQGNASGNQVAPNADGSLSVSGIAGAN